MPMAARMKMDQFNIVTRFLERRTGLSWEIDFIHRPILTSHLNAPITTSIFVIRPTVCQQASKSLKITEKMSGDCVAHVIRILRPTFYSTIF